MTDYERGWRDGVEAAAQEVGTWAACGDKHMDRIRALRPVEPAPEPAPRCGRCGGTGISPYVRFHCDYCGGTGRKDRG